MRDYQSTAYVKTPLIVYLIYEIGFTAALLTTLSTSDNPSRSVVWMVVEVMSILIKVSGLSTIQKSWRTLDRF